MRKGDNSPRSSDLSDRLPMRNTSKTLVSHKSEEVSPKKQQQSPVKSSFYVRKMSQEFAENLVVGKSSPAEKPAPSTDFVKNMTAKFDSKRLKRAETVDSGRPLDLELKIDDFKAEVEKVSPRPKSNLVFGSRLRRSESAAVSSSDADTSPSAQRKSIFGFSKKISVDLESTSEVNLSFQKEGEFLTQDYGDAVEKNLFSGFQKLGVAKSPNKIVRRSISTDFIGGGDSENVLKGTTGVSESSPLDGKFEKEKNGTFSKAGDGAPKHEKTMSLEVFAVKKGHVRNISHEFDRRANEQSSVGISLLQAKQQSSFSATAKLENSNGDQVSSLYKSNTVENLDDVGEFKAPSRVKPKPSLSFSTPPEKFTPSSASLESSSPLKEESTFSDNQSVDSNAESPKPASKSSFKRLLSKLNFQGKSKPKDDYQSKSTIAENPKDSHESNVIISSPEAAESDLEKCWRMRRDVLKEMLETEESYLRDLEVLNEVYILPLQSKASNTGFTTENANLSMTLSKRGKSNMSSYPVRRSQSIQLLSVSKDNFAFMKSPIVAVLFSTVQHIRKLNSQLCKKLRELVALDTQSKHVQDSVAIAEVFLSYAPLFKLYCEYAKGYEQVIALLKQYTADSGVSSSISPQRNSRVRRSIFKGTSQNSPTIPESVDEDEKEFNLKAFLDQAMNSPSCMGKPIQSYLILPIQRVPRYELLLRELQKVSPDGHPDKSLIPQAITEIHKAVIYTDLQLANLDIRKKLREIEDSFQGSLALIDTVPPREELRRLQKKGSAKCTKLVNKSRKEESVVLFLFDDFLVLSTPTSEGIYKMMDQIYLVDCALEEHVRLGSLKIREECAFSIESEYGTYIIEVESLNEKKEWTSTITANIMKEKRLQGLKTFKKKEMPTHRSDEGENSSHLLINQVRVGIRQSEMKRLALRFQDIQILKEDDPNVVSGKRYLVKDGFLTASIMVKANNFKKSNSKFFMSLFLLSDYLLISKSASISTSDHSNSMPRISRSTTILSSSSESRFDNEVIDLIPMSRLEIIDLALDTSEENSKLMFRLKSQNSMYNFSASSESEKKDWFSQIQACILRSKEDTKLSGKNDDKRCFLCRSEFFIFQNRRYTCKNCMFYVCSSCSKTRVKLPSYSTVKEARVCDRCVKEGIRKSKDIVDNIDDEFIPNSSENTALTSENVPIPDDMAVNRFLSFDASFSTSLKGFDLQRTSPANSVFSRPEEAELGTRLSDNLNPLKLNSQNSERNSIEIESFVFEDVKSDSFFSSKYALVQDTSIKEFLKIEESYEWKLPPAAILLYESSEELQKKMLIKSCKDCQTLILAAEMFCGKCGYNAAESFNTSQYGSRVLWHLYCTELIYVSSLGLLANDLARDLLDLMIFDDSETTKKKRRNTTLSPKRSVVLTTDQATFMSSLSQLYTLHETFLRGIFKYIQMRRFSEASFREPLSQFVPFWGIYSDFIANFDQVRKLLKSNDFIEYLRSKSLSIDHVDQLLHFPLMRIQQYGPFIEEISKSIPRENPDYTFSQDCIQKIQEKILQLRTNVTDIYRFHVLEELENEFDSDFLVTFPGRYLICRANCIIQKLKVQGKKKKAPSDIHLLLFSDILVQSEYNKEKKLVPFEITDLKLFMSASDVSPYLEDDEKLASDFSLKLCSKEGVEIWFAFEDAETMNLWIKNINCAIEDSLNRDSGSSSNTLNNSGSLMFTSRERRSSSAVMNQSLPSPSHSTFKEHRCQNCKSFTYESQSFCSYCGLALAK